MNELHDSPTETGLKNVSGLVKMVLVLPAQKLGPSEKSKTLNVIVTLCDKLPLVPVMVAL